MPLSVPDTFAPSVNQGEMPMVPATGPWVSPMKNAAPGLLQQTGQTLSQSGETAARIGNTIVDRMQETFDEANVRNAETSFLTSANDILTRYTHSLGKDAIDGYEPAKQAIVKAKQAVQEGLSNEWQAQTFNRVATQHLVEFGKQLSDHQFQQNVQFGTQAANDRADTFIQQAANDYDGWQLPAGKFVVNKTLAIQETQKAAALLGLPPDSPQAQALVKHKTTELAQGVILRMTQNEQYPEAQQYFDKAVADGEIDEHQAEMLGNMVREGHNAQKGALLADAARQAGLGAQDTSQQRAQPVSIGSITSTMGAPRPGGRVHDGIDLAVPVGTKVQVPANGTVSKVWEDDKFGGGLSMEITYPNGNVEGFAHLSAVNYQPGQQVTQGTVVALSGKSGNATGPVLHWAMKDKDGNWIDPRSSVGAPKNTDEFTQPEQFEKGLAYINSSDATDRVKDIATAKLRSQYGLARELENQKYDQAKQNAVDWMVQNGNQYDTMPPTLKVLLRPSDAQAFRDAQDEDQRKASEISLLANWIQHPEQQTVAAVKEAFAKGQLTNSTYLSALKEATDMQSHPQKVIEVAVNGEQIDATLLRNGYQNLAEPDSLKDPKDKLAAKEQKVQFVTNIRDQVNAAQEASGRPLTWEQKQQVIDQTLMNKAFLHQHRALRPDLETEMPLFEMTPAQRARAYVNVDGRSVRLDSIPPSERVKAIVALQKHGMPVTEQTIADLWVKAGMRGGVTMRAGQ